MPQLGVVSYPAVIQKSTEIRARNDRNSKTKWKINDSSNIINITLFLYLSNKSKQITRQGSKHSDKIQCIMRNVQLLDCGYFSYVGRNSDKCL